MTTPVVAAFAAVWFVAVGGLAASARSRSSGLVIARLDMTALPNKPYESSESDGPGVVALARRWWGEAAGRVGRPVRRAVRRPAHVTHDRRLGAAILSAAMALSVDVRLAVIVGLLSWMRPIRAERQAVQQRQAIVVRELPEVVDLLSVAVRGGLTVPLAVAAVGERLNGEVATALQLCVDEAALGQRLSDRLDLVPAQLGDATRPLIRALVAADRYGVPIGEPLERVAVDVRTARRRSAEIAARRVPIKLLFPLVFCVLPSFALLTVAPVLASSLESLRL